MRSKSSGSWRGGIARGPGAHHSGGSGVTTNNRSTEVALGKVELSAGEDLVYLTSPRRKFCYSLVVHARFLSGTYEGVSNFVFSNSPFNSNIYGLRDKKLNHCRTIKIAAVLKW